MELIEGMLRDAADKVKAHNIKGALVMAQTAVKLLRDAIELLKKDTEKN